MPNALASATSPYLRQHAGNPVAWLEWGEAAFARARAEDKPVFLSIGYSTCHWCHVMARESFENEAVAAQINRDFIPVKVDREERPDVDRVYMTYVQARSGHGGWPLNVWLTPDLKPFFGGTYFAPEDREGRRGLPALLGAIAEAWKTRRADLVAEADRAIVSLENHYKDRAASVADSGGPGARPAGEAAEPAPASGPAGENAPVLLHDAAGDAYERGFMHLYESFDAERGGFGGAPKFPRAGNIDFLLRVAALQGGSSTETGREALKLASHTLRRMCEGGIHDHLGGGFHRYAVDEAWFVPHFEKMLHDQAQIARNLLDCARATGDERLAWAARGVFDYLLRDLAHPAGGFFSAEDADSERVRDGAGVPPAGLAPEQGRGAHAAHAEGAFYVWTRAEIDRVLPPADAALVCAHFGIETAGNVPVGLDPHGEFAGRNILRQRRPFAETAGALGLPDVAAAADRLAGALDRLRAARAARPRPHRDDKILAAWNGLALSALARAAVHPAECLADKRPFHLEAARHCAGFIERELFDPRSSTLRRSWREGRATVDAFAEDYACVVAGLLDLHQATLEARWLRLAEALQRTMDRLFWDEAGGGYFSAPADTELVLRLKDDYDGAEPTASSVALGNLVRLSVLAGESLFATDGHRARARALAEAFRSQWSAAPHALPAFLCGLADLLSEPAHVVLAGDPREPGFGALAEVVYSAPAPNAPLCLLTPACADWAAGMTPVDGRPAAYFCRDYACQGAVTDPADLRRLLMGAG